MASDMIFLVWLWLLVLGVSNAPAYPPDGIANTTYDYIIVGCGIAGLVVAMRLSEDRDISVLCLEAGQFDVYEEMIQFPVYIGQEPYGFYDWNLTTVPQTQLDGRPRNIPVGMGVGGGSLTNGMLWNRGNAADFDAWASLGNQGWGWNDLLPYFKKSETFTPICYPNSCSAPPIDFLAIDHGFCGPLNVSYPNYFWRQTSNYLDALNELGVPTTADPNNGSPVGGYFIPSSVDPIRQTRSDARRAYYDPYSSRPNLVVRDHAQVTRLLFQSNEMSRAITHGLNSSTSPLVARGVEFASDASALRQIVLASREVIIAAGALHTPQLLQLSGLGSASALRDLGIAVLQDLPGVGNNLQDHCMIHLNYSYQTSAYTTPFTSCTNATFNQASGEQYLSSRTGPWTGRPSTAVAFPSLPHVANATYIASLLNTTQQSDRCYPSTYESTLRAGYDLQFNSMLSRLALNTTPAYENLNNNAGGLDVSLMHPLSRGTVQINSTNPFDPPLVDPRWLVNPLDTAIMVAAMQFNQRILDTASISELQPSYEQIPANASEDFLHDLLARSAGTEFHYSGTAAMMPRELGGVVDSTLRVYGTQNLRVVDSAVFPLIPAAHLQAVVYGVSEKAADIIRGANSTTGTSTSSAQQPPSSAYYSWLMCHIGLGNTTAEAN